MRRTRMLVAICFVLIVTPMLLGAHAIGIVVTPNPGGNKGQIKGEGFYTLDATDTFVMVTYATTDSGTGITTSANDATGGGGWAKTILAIPAGTYNPNKATLFYTDVNNKVQNFPTTDKNNYVVK